MHNSATTPEATRKLLDDTILASPELELFRDVFAAVYGQDYASHYERWSTTGEVEPKVVDYCRARTGPQ